MNITLLTHPREISKSTNTGALVLDVLGEKSNLVIWERTKPNAGLLEQIGKGSVALLYPTEDSEVVSSESDFDSYIVLDGTWQEAQKIFNRSPYLKDLPKVRIESSTQSIFNLRRNQKANGLCTAECVIELLRAKSFKESADALQIKLEAFIANR